MGTLLELRVCKLDFDLPVIAMCAQSMRLQPNPIVRSQFHFHIMWLRMAKQLGRQLGSARR